MALKIGSHRTDQVARVFAQKIQESEKILRLVVVSITPHTHATLPLNFREWVTNPSKDVASN